MELRRDFFLTFGMLMLFHMVLAFGSIALFMRMGPAIEKILAENVYSIEAAQEMLLLMAQEEEQPDVDQFHQWLIRAKNNITVPEEEPVLRRIEQAAQNFENMDESARTMLLNDIEELIAINQNAMQKADTQARDLGIAGAWAAVWIAVLAFALGWLSMRRLYRRVIAPIEELHDVLVGVGQGDLQRRCTTTEAPADVRRTLSHVNIILDALQDAILHRRGSSYSLQPIARQALTRFLDERPRPCAIVDSHGEVIAASAKLLQKLQEDTGTELRDQLRHPEKSAMRCTPLQGGWIVELQSSEE